MSRKFIALGSAREISLYSKGEDTWEFSRGLLGLAIFPRSKRRTADGYLKEQFLSCKYLSSDFQLYKRRKEGEKAKTRGLLSS